MRIKSSVAKGYVLLLATVVLMTTACSQEPAAKLEDHLPMYQGW